MSTRTAETLDHKLNQLIHGVQATLTSGQSFIIDGQSYDPASLLTALRSQVEPFDAATSAAVAQPSTPASTAAAPPNGAAPGDPMTNGASH
ncbi:MAG: hypothetical protein JST54_29570 [Deltaproteobacteria bacterium]|nr:hypothetical protein [Deltaproteobacteria bacterium]